MRVHDASPGVETGRDEKDARDERDDETTSGGAAGRTTRSSPGSVRATRSPQLPPSPSRHRRRARAVAPTPPLPMRASHRSPRRGAAMGSSAASSAARCSSCSSSSSARSRSSSSRSSTRRREVGVNRYVTLRACAVAVPLPLHGPTLLNSAPGGACAPRRACRACDGYSTFVLRTPTPTMRRTTTTRVIAPVVCHNAHRHRNVALSSSSRGAFLAAFAACNALQSKFNEMECNGM